MAGEVQRRNLSAAARDAFGLRDSEFNRAPIGTGPFVFEGWTPGSEVRLSANKDYFEGAPKFEALVLRLIKDETAAAIALEKGEIDIFTYGANGAPGGDGEDADVGNWK